MKPAVPPIPELIAPPSWGTVDFISDLHLQAGDPRTFEAWADYLHHTCADAVFILGDLFDVWIGDDTIASPSAADQDSDESFETRCARTLRSAGQHRGLYFMHGNRDFLLGPSAADQCAMKLLSDPTVLSFAGQRWLLSHGDALCLDDLPYQQWRQQVRQSDWQNAFLSKPLAERRSIAQGLRAQSEAHKRATQVYADLDTAATQMWMSQARATEMIHGHTHRPADHVLAAGLKRRVLSDWDLSGTPAHSQVMRLKKK